MTPNEFDLSSYLNGGNAVFVEELYAKYLKNPDSIDASWRKFFTDLRDPAPYMPSWSEMHKAIIGAKDPEAKPGAPAGKAAPAAAPATGANVEATARDSVRTLMMIHAYRVRGHLMADLDPLGLEGPKAHPELDPATYGFAEKDYDRQVFLDGVLGLKTATIREVLNILRQTYCGKIGTEYMHIQFPEQKAWIQQRIEGSRATPRYDGDQKKTILKNLIEVEAFEQFLNVKYQGMKRFSIQGGDALIPGLEAAILKASELGVEEIAFGMPHRGRLSVLTSVLAKPFTEILSLFQGNIDFPEWVESSGDVKYHLGTSVLRPLPNGKNMYMSLTANPSHLEAVNPVVLGKVRAKMDQKNDTDKTRVMGIVLHGDAAFAGQGSVAETLALSELRGYRTGGTINIIVNNQIGFTTAPSYSRFTPYPSDVAKAVQAPIFHVNGDDPEAVAFVCQLAAEFRQTFHRDVVVDIVCYRKYGHNEGDEPAFTQPIMYRSIRSHEAPSTIYSKRLVSENVLSDADVQKQFDDYKAFFDKEQEVAKEYKPNKANWLEGQWAGLEKPKGEHPDGDTGVDIKLLREIGTAITATPENFELHKGVVRFIEARKKAIDSGEGIDWATGEALAFTTLLREGYPVRLSGQDCGRGTFTQRHSVWIDQQSEERYQPFNNVGAQKSYEVIDSSLSEFAIMGFEYGYSLAEPGALVMWEGQFGDFANGAQVIIDQFVSSSEAKWLRMSGLVLLLPHGYEGQGPEHSSARLERFLQMCGEDNMQVVNATTPANYFHVLRRQLHRKFRKPLIMMTPKSLLRHKLAVSTLTDLAKGTSFKRVIGETAKLTKEDKIRRVILCSGKVYYDLFEAREKSGQDDIAILRLEQFYPFPARELKAELSKYPKAEVMWCQEEPKNMGGWSFTAPRLMDLLEEMGRDFRVNYAGRPEAASPACGYLKIHTREQQALVADALAEAQKLRKRA